MLSFHYFIPISPCLLQQHQKIIRLVIKLGCLVTKTINIYLIHIFQTICIMYG